MASPPLMVEDQTDEDFFDKLVDDDNDTEVRVSDLGIEYVDEGKVFSNLGIEESLFGSEKVVVVDEKITKNVETGKNPSVVIKEVQWSSFSASDSTQANGFGSYSDFLNDFGEDGLVDPFENLGDTSDPMFSFREDVVVDSSTNTQVDQFANVGDNVDPSPSIGEDVIHQQTADPQYWENLYPGWRYDSTTAQWHQVVTEDSYQGSYETVDNVVSEAPNSQNFYQGNFENNHQLAGDNVFSDQRSDISYLQQTAQSVVGTVAEGCSTSSVFSGTEYPAHMVFDPQYPGWYYDTIGQEWRVLESYTPSVQSASVATHGHQIQNGNASSTSFLTNNNHSAHQDYGQVRSYEPQSLGSNHVGQNVNMCQPDIVAKTDVADGFTQNQNSQGIYDSSSPLNNYNGQQSGFKPLGTTYDGNSGMTGYQGFVPSENFSQQNSQPRMENTQKQYTHFSNDYYGGKGSYGHQPFQNNSQFSRDPNEGRSSAGRPPHTLVTFGFGGKLLVMKDSSSYAVNPGFGSQDSGSGGAISILNLMDVVTEKSGATNIGFGACGYFPTLCQQSFPGPLVGGNVGTKELFKWIDERIANCESSDMDYRKGELLSLLISLLKIACQHYGKLRSPFGTDQALKENDSPESAVAKLFASAKRNGAQPNGYGALTHCLQNLPSESQVQATAIEVQNLLVSGRTKEALQCAQEGQLWGTALVLAAHLGDQFHVETVKQMACRQLVAGSPLRTLCLLIAGQPAEVFSAENTTSNGPNAAANMYHQPAQIASDCMLDDWEENLAVITANRTKGDELVIVHLGDCLWKQRGEITAAHTCYLVAEANFESYSDIARLCLIGADHWKFPRTFASPEAIQRTELYEYSLVLGNSQSVLLPFQPYKLVYAYMLAEVGKVSDSMKYCQAILKSLKTGRAPEVETWRQLVSTLEDRLRINQQGGYGTNLAPKLVGKLLPFIDRSIHRMIGASPPPAPLTSPNSVRSNEHDNHSIGPRVSNSQSTMAMSSLVPSDSMEPISGWTGDNNRKGMYNRSISEPDFGRTPRQGVSSKKAVSSDAQGRSSAPSRFGRFGSQILQKTMGWVSRSQSDRQAKLGEKNKFYYDEKLKRWVEEGTDPPIEETTPPPPPTMSFQNGMSDYNMNDAFRTEGYGSNGGPTIKSPTPSERNSGIPPIPPNSNQFSARGRIGVRSRYVDTFNKGGGNPTNSFLTNPVPTSKPGSATNAKFFIPTASGEQMKDTIIGENFTNEDPPNKDSLFSTPPPSSASASSLSSPMQRFPSMDNIAPVRNRDMRDASGSLSSRSRRTVSWSGGSFSDSYNQNKRSEVTSLGEALGMPQTLFNPSPSRLPMNGDGSYTDDLQEVEL
ncbi:hypothetical protein GIB67_001235 [Kingdonia uniflora]|uniref:Protein transport protein sec16 n=1 Tax=Kingdonia uniflora TaxID=39325 RepID=A0A7J7LGD2_9MAGN|nr:hypothetical protein GIB67_001235 [Kingdonia uniflora]